MANRTDPTARSIRGTNPQNLVNRIVRERIYQTTYWKEKCFGLTAETLVDKAMELDYVGGTFGGTHKATPFLCLVGKMLQIQPEKEIVVEFIKNEDHEYVRILGAFYLRLTATDTDVYMFLEPLYNDYRKLRRKDQDGRFVLTRVDEFIEELLTKDRCCDITLPRIDKRSQLESKGSLELRRSALEDDFEEEEEKEEDEVDVGAADHEKDHYRSSSPHRERDRERKRDCHRYRDRDYRDYERDRDCDRYWIREKGYGGDREREGGRDRERRDRERDRRRRRSQSRSRSREREEGENGDREEPKKKKQKSEKKDGGTEHPDAEIAEANTLRAQLGLKPLRL